MKTPWKTIQRIARKSPVRISFNLFRRKSAHTKIKRTADLIPYRNIYLTIEDYTLIMTWAKERKITKMAMGHIVVNGYLLCTEQDHLAKMNQLATDRGLLCDELARYIEHFGKLPATEKTPSKTTETTKTRT